jgi:hypothetical protein
MRSAQARTATVQRKQVIFTCFRCTPAELFASCLTLLRRHHDQVSPTHNEQRQGNGLGTTINYLRSTTSGNTGNSLGATIKNLWRTTSGAAGSGLGTTIKYMRGAAVNGLGTTIKYLRLTKRLRPGHHDGSM